MSIFGAIEGYPTSDEIDTLGQIIQDGNYTIKAFESWFLPPATPEYKSLFLQRLLWDEQINPIVKSFEEEYGIKVSKDEIIYSKTGQSIFLIKELDNDQELEKN